ncbi:MAG: hypothetical protein MMC23_007479 [Stictis urceolatum]|nr:hypothetical protein [Stictis urceolata]
MNASSQPFTLNRGTASSLATESYSTQGKETYITLAEGDHMNALHTCGDILRGHVHFRPNSSETTLSSLVVNFKCKVRTTITTQSSSQMAGAGPGLVTRSSRTYKSKVYLFDFGTTYIHSPTQITSYQSFPFKFIIPWTVLPHPTQFDISPHPNFEAIGPHTPLPPTLIQTVLNNVETIQYYLEVTALRLGMMITHKLKDRLPILFCPPRQDPHPASQLAFRSNNIFRESRLLDPKKAAEPYGLKERAHHFFHSKEDPDPHVSFTIHSSVPSVGCVNAPLPVTLDLIYNEAGSSAPVQPPVYLASLYARLTSFTDYRALMRSVFGDGQIVRQHSQKIDLCHVSLNTPVPLGEGTDLNAMFPQLGLGLNTVPTFRSPTISRWYVIKITAVVVSAEKKSEIELGKHGFVVLPGVVRQFPGPMGMEAPSVPPPMMPMGPGLENWHANPQAGIPAEDPMKMDMGSSKPETAAEGAVGYEERPHPQEPQRRASEETLPAYEEVTGDREGLDDRWTGKGHDSLSVYD